MRKVLLAALCAALTVVWVTGAGASPTADVRLTNDCVVPSAPDPATPQTAPPGYVAPPGCDAGTPDPGYVSEYTLATGIPVTNDTVINECSIAHGRQNEPAVQMDPRDPSVILGSSNDYCGVYSTKDANGLPVAGGPIWLGYYRSTNGGASFQSSLVPGYPGDTSPYAALSQARTASAGDPVIAWDAHGRAFFASESSGDPAGTKKTFGDEWVATFDNPDGPNSTNTNLDGLRYRGTTVVAHGSSAPNLLGVFHDKTAIEADHTGTSPCDGDVYFAWARFTGVNTSNIYFARSTDHGQTFSSPKLLTPKVKNVQDPDISVTGNGHVYVTFDEYATTSQADSVGVVKSTDCGATFSPPAVLVHDTTYIAQDIADPTSPASPSQPDDPAGDEEPAAPASVAGDCGDFADHCQSGFTFFRRGTTTRSTADQFDSAHEWLYVVFDAARGPILDTGTTYGTITPGKAADTGAYYVRYDGATGDATTPVLLDPAGTEQTFPDISADAGVLHVEWWDARKAPADCRSPIRPIGNCSDRTSVPALDVYAKTGTSDASGTTWAPSVRVSGVTTNGNWEQFDNRAIPFGGDYLYITSHGINAFGTWTDWRNTRPGSDPRESPEDEDAATTDVYQCRAVLTSTDKKGNTTTSFSSDLCPHSGGLDQNIYGDQMP